MARDYAAEYRRALEVGWGEPPTERQRKSRHRLRGTPVPEGVKHGIYTFKVYGCRCEACLLAHRQQLHRHNNRWMYRNDLHGRWTQRMQDGTPIDVLCWPPADAGPDWKCPHEEVAG